jgi:UDP-N-acetylmuramate: L-alanyl-gamma-D-glutamyl-meso-diaminopimelate ligase
VSALESFTGVKRRLEVLGTVNNITVYDDFAHHPTAIRASLDALRAAVGTDKIICVLEPRSNTMRLGMHAPLIADALKPADVTYIYHDSGSRWDPHSILEADSGTCHVLSSVDEIIKSLVTHARPDDHIVIMSNGGFANIHARLLQELG